MEKAKDGVTLIADAIRSEMAQSEKENTTNTEVVSNVIDVTAQFNKRHPPAKAAECIPDVSDKSDISNDGNKDDVTKKKKKKKKRITKGNEYYDNDFFKEKNYKRW